MTIAEQKKPSVETPSAEPQKKNGRMNGHAINGNGKIEAAIPGSLLEIATPKKSDEEIAVEKLSRLLAGKLSFNIGPKSIHLSPSLRNDKNYVTIYIEGARNKPETAEEEAKELLKLQHIATALDLAVPPAVRECSSCKTGNLANIQFNGTLSDLAQIGENQFKIKYENLVNPAVGMTAV